ncbi:MAG: SBBP repeat-containing protein, partial [Planctomycetes bacterium]|nr:SBBP repeat-containing protein [Planctomycetota bacterium]
MTGRTASPGWTSGGYDIAYSNAYDAFVAKLDFNGQHLWSTYLGGDVNDTGSAIAVDSEGYVYVAGDSL